MRNDPFNIIDRAHRAMVETERQCDATAASIEQSRTIVKAIREQREKSRNAITNADHVPGPLRELNETSASASRNPTDPPPHDRGARDV